MQFEEAVKIILYHEGGLVDHAKDPGGLTNFGISQRAYPQLDIRNLTPEIASEIYRSDYWDRFKVGELPPALRLAVFDSAVNQGGTAALGLLQAALGLEVTGKPSPALTEKAASVSSALVLKKFIFLRWQRYAKHKNFSTFAAGWARRLLDISLESALRLGNERQGA